MEGILFQAVVRKVSTLVDGSLTVQLETPELGNEEAAKLLSLRKIQGLVYISPKNKIDGAIMDTVDGQDIEVSGGKSPSKRLRDRLFVYWKQNPGIYQDFEMFYIHELDAFGQTFLAKLKEQETPWAEPSAPMQTKKG